jgi:hypothetical protein
MNNNIENLKKNILDLIDDDIKIESKNLNLLIKDNIIFIHIEITDKKIIDSSNIIYNKVKELLDSIEEYKGFELKISYSVIDNSSSSFSSSAQIEYCHPAPDAGSSSGIGDNVKSVVIRALTCSMGTESIYQILLIILITLDPGSSPG